MRIIKATEPIPVEHPIFLIFGQPGICKTSLAYSAGKNPLLLDFDKGAHRSVNRGDTLAIDSWKDVVELMADKKAIEPYDVVIIDTVGRALDVISADIAATDPKKAPGGNLSQQGWGVLKNRFRQWMSAIRAEGKDVLLIAHDKEDKDGDLRIVRPEIVGGSYGEVMKIADFVGYLYMNGRDRVLDFNPTDRWIGKNPAGWNAMRVPPPEKATDFLVKLIDLGREALGNISEESAKVVQGVNDWRTKIENMTEAKELTAAVPETQKLAPIVAPQVKKLLSDRAKALGFTYDTTAKKFIKDKAKDEQPEDAEAVPA